MPKAALNSITVKDDRDLVPVSQSFFVNQALPLHPVDTGSNGESAPVYLKGDGVQGKSRVTDSSIWPSIFHWSWIVWDFSPQVYIVFQLQHVTDWPLGLKMEEGFTYKQQSSSAGRSQENPFIY